LGLEIVIPASNTYKNALSKVKHYYSDHTCQSFCHEISILYII